MIALLQKAARVDPIAERPTQMASIKARRPAQVLVPKGPTICR